MSALKTLFWIGVAAVTVIAVALLLRHVSAPRPASIDPDAPDRSWRYIIIHHSAGWYGSDASLRKMHESRGWADDAYHMVIGNGSATPDGTVEFTRRWREQLDGAHAGVREYNHRGIGICIVGDLDKGPMTAAQLRALEKLLVQLQARYAIPTSSVLRHSDISRTRCPGRYFSRSTSLSNAVSSTANGVQTAVTKRTTPSRRKASR